MPEVLNMPIILNTIRSNDKYSSELKDIAPDIKADIVSFQANPNCGCRRKIAEYLDKNKESETVKGFIQKWSTDIPNQLIEVKPGEKIVPGANGVTSVRATGLPPTSPRHPMKPMVGHVVEIPASPDEYKKLLEHAKSDFWMYRGLSVLPKDDKWLVFFY